MGDALGIVGIALGEKTDTATTAQPAAKKERHYKHERNETAALRRSGADAESRLGGRRSGLERETATHEQRKVFYGFPGKPGTGTARVRAAIAHIASLNARLQVLNRG